MSLTASTYVTMGIDLADRYFSLIRAYCLNRDEDALIAAYDVAREAMSAQMSLADYSVIHHQALGALLKTAPPSEGLIESAEEFFLQSIAVYDMAIRGYQSNVSRLQGEISERRRVEDELRDITFDLARQRDELDQQVRQRTEEIHDRARALEQTNRALLQANREQADFTYALSHDLKTPINTIDMFLQTLLEDFRAQIDAEAIELIMIASETADRMKTMIDDVLEYARVVEHSFQVEPIDLGRLVREIVADMQAAITEAEAELTVAPLPVVLGNPLQLRILFTNLMSNALKYRSPDRRPEITIAADPGAEGGRCRITVTDNGIGMRPDQTAHVFELFKRLHTYDEIPGSGIGLALCKRVANNHGTEIRLQSEPGAGSSFGIDLEKGDIA